MLSVNISRLRAINVNDLLPITQHAQYIIKSFILSMNYNLFQNIYEIPELC